MGNQRIIKNKNMFRSAILIASAMITSDAIAKLEKLDLDQKDYEDLNDDFIDMFGLDSTVKLCFSLNVAYENEFISDGEAKSLIDQLIAKQYVNLNCDKVLGLD